MKNQPLVSIIIITYNSSEFVLDTLNSAIAQTYPNIEIIISDDCSTDNTVEICRQWINDNSRVGKSIKIVTSERNTGVSGNCNRGYRTAKGEWLKFIAGDDMLAPSAISDYVGYVTQQPKVHHLIAKAIHFTGKLKESDFNNPDEISMYLYRNEVSVKKQYSVIKKTFFGSGPTYFIKAEALNKVGGFDERFPMQEDYPLFIKMIGAGYKMMYLDKVTVYKRMVPTSIQYDKDNGTFFSKHEIRVISEYKYLYRKEVLGAIWRIFHYYSIGLQSSIIKRGNSKKSISCCLLYCIYTFTDPFVWFSRYIAYKNKSYLKRHN